MFVWTVNDSESVLIWMHGADYEGENEGKTKGELLREFEVKLK